PGDGHSDAIGLGRRRRENEEADGRFDLILRISLRVFRAAQPVQNAERVGEGLTRPRTRPGNEVAATSESRDHRLLEGGRSRELVILQNLEEIFAEADIFEGWHFLVILTGIRLRARES